MELAGGLEFLAVFGGFVLVRVIFGRRHDHNLILEFEPGL